MIDPKTVGINGAGTGIGRALTTAAAHKGFNVILASRSESTLAETMLACDGGNVRRVIAEVTTSQGQAAIRTAVTVRWTSLSITQAFQALAICTT